MELARFMREMVNVPFSFAMLESDGQNRPVRFQHAASVLKSAARDLAHWEDPPTGSEAARAVFFAYAQDLERHVVRLEIAASTRDIDETSHHLESIRQTCNSCHRFFRPASAISGDVVYDRLTIDLGGLQ